MVSNLIFWAIRHRHVEIHPALSPVPQRWDLWLMHGPKRRLRLLSSDDKELLLDVVRKIKQDAAWGAEHAEA